MDNIFGSNLKKLRQQKGLTQEQVATTLGVSYQAVSKWENGVANPDLTFILPLARLLEVSTDQLLGADCPPDKERKEQMLCRIKSVSNWKPEGRAICLQAAKEFVDEFPNDPDALFHYERCLGDYISFDASEEEKPQLLLLREQYCKKYLALHGAGGRGQKAVILSLIDVLCALDKRAEAVELAKAQTGDKEFQLDCYSKCLEGDERTIMFLKNVSEKAHAFLNALYKLGDEGAFQTAEDFLNLMDPVPTDGHYDSLIALHDKKVRYYLDKGRLDDAMRELAVCADLACKQERHVQTHPEEEPWYGVPFFAKCTSDKELYRDFNPHHMVLTFLTAPSRKVLFEREDHKKLVETVTQRMNAYDPFNEKKS